MLNNEDIYDADLYQPKMLLYYFKAGMQNVHGTMEAFVRKLPRHRKFMVVCGIERIIEFLQTLHFDQEAIDDLKSLFPDVEFDQKLIDYLLSIDFSALKIRAMQDGDIIFANEPFISVTGPIGVVQFIEKKVLSILNTDVRIASKAARIKIACGDKTVSEFGGRRGGDKISAEAARAAYIGGFDSTSNWLAWKKYGIPVIGTMGHVLIMSHLGKGGEERAYANWGKIFKNSTYLPDTYNFSDGLEKVLKACKGNIGGIRVDSDDMFENSCKARRVLNNSGNYNAVVIGTNNLNEYKIQSLRRRGAHYDGFGVGTDVVATPDSPTCDIIYKLVHVSDPELGNEMVAKIADGVKGTLPGEKEIFRYKINNLFTHDVLGLSCDTFKTPFEPRLVERNIKNWNANLYTAKDARNLFLQNLREMPEHIKIIMEQESELEPGYHVSLSDSLKKAVEIFQTNEH